MMNVEEMYRAENKSIITYINDKELTHLFIDIVSSITSDIEEWQTEYIFYEDDDIHNSKNGNLGRAILMDKVKWANASINKKIDLREIDLGALLNLLQYRLLMYKKIYSLKDRIIKNRQKPESFDNLIKFVRDDFRKLGAHTSPVDLEEIFADNKKIYGKLKDLKTLIESVVLDCEEFLERGKDVRYILEKFIEKRFMQIQNAYYTAKIGEDIKYSEERDISIEDLYTYNIIVDHTIFLHKDEFRTVRSLVRKGKCIFVEQTILNQLRVAQMQGLHSEKEMAKDSIEELMSWVEDNYELNKSDEYKPKLIILKNASVIDKLKEAREAKWCILTLDSLLANDVWNLRKKNVIVLKPKKRAKFEIYRKMEENLLDHKFKVDVIVGRGETKLKETINMVDSDWYDYQYSDKAKNVLNEENAESYNKTDIVQCVESVEEYIFDNDDIPKTGMAVYTGIPKSSGSGRYMLSNCVGGGGEGQIYEYEDDETKYAKIYKKGQLTSLKVKKLESLVAHKDDFIDTNICCPQNILCHSKHWDKKVIVGYSMRKANRKGKRTLGTIREVIARIVRGEKEYDKFNRKDLVLICYNCSLLFDTLHKKNFLMGDVNPDNIMIDEDKDVFFIDMDSYQFDGFTCPVGITEFTSPEMLKKMDKKRQGYEYIERTINDEMFAVAVLYFYILFLSEFPYNINERRSSKDCILKHRFRFSNEKKSSKEEKRNYIWQNLTEELREMFKNNFGTSKRYMDYEWTVAFNNLIEKIYDENDQEQSCESASSNENSQKQLSECVLSNEIFPYSAIEKGQVWESLVCDKCKITFKTAREPGKPLKNGEDVCPRCKEIAKILQKRIYKLICPKCKEIWTINKWDVNGKNVDEIYCPDCDDKFYMSKTQEIDEYREEGRFKEGVEHQMSYAFKWYKEDID